MSCSCFVQAYAASRQETTVWEHFFRLLNNTDGYINNMTARVIAKMSCWSREKMVGSDLKFYITWLKDQLTLNVMSL